MKLEGADSTPVTTRALVKDGGLDEILKKIEGIGAFDGPLPTLRATKSTMPATSKAAARKRGEKPLSIPDLVISDEHEIGGTGGARIIIRANKAKLKLENVTLPMWIAANSRIMQELLTTGRLSALLVFPIIYRVRSSLLSFWRARPSCQWSCMTMKVAA